MPEQRPFADQQKLTRTERRAAAERARRRREALAEAQREGSLLDWDPTEAVLTTRPAGTPNVPSQPGAPAWGSTGAVPAWAQQTTVDEPTSSADDDEARSVLSARKLQKIARAEEGLPQRSPNARYALGLTAATLGYAAMFGAAASVDLATDLPTRLRGVFGQHLLDLPPVLGTELGWWHLLAALAALLAGSWWAWRHQPEVTHRFAGTGLALSLLVCAAFTTGTFTSVVVNGKVYAAGSATARAYELSTEMYDDLRYLASVDPLLDAEQAQARSQYAQYAPTAERLAEISRKWAGVVTDPSEVPSPAFLEVANHTANAADWASKAMVRKSEVILQPDARGEADVSSYRATFHTELLTAGSQLREVAALYSIELESNGPQE